MPPTLCKPVRFCREHPVKAVLAYLLIISVIFLSFPVLDKWTTGTFYNSAGHFPFATDPVFRGLRYFGSYVFKWVAGLSLAVLLFKIALPKIKPIMDLRHPIFMLSTLILGPGIIINLFFKNQWGRPRPRHTELFGGELPFITIWHPTNYCKTNCSFMSGEASASVWLLALVFIAPRSWRPVLLSILGVFAFVISANRIAFGGHYLSDTLLSWGITMLVIIGVHWYLYKRTPAWAQPENLDKSLTGLGLWIQKKIYPSRK